MIEFKILGQPIAWQANIGIRQGDAHDPIRKEKQLFLTSALDRGPKEIPDYPICVKLTFYMERPADHFETRKNVANRMLKSRSPKLCTDAPNSNDLAKFVLVALDGVFWQQKDICDLQVKKQYSSKPRTEIAILECEL